MSTNKRERDRDTPRSLASSESSQTTIQDDELGRLPLRDDVDFSTQAYLDQANQSVTNESSPDSDHISPPQTPKLIIPTAVSTNKFQTIITFNPPIIRTITNTILSPDCKCW
jgi:hypothetical protein